MLPGSWKRGGLVSRHRNAVLPASCRRGSAVILSVFFCENVVRLTGTAERLEINKAGIALRRHYSV